jgi:hypothetical protein
VLAHQADGRRRDARLLDFPDEHTAGVRTQRSGASHEDGVDALRLQSPSDFGT